MFNWFVERFQSAGWVHAANLDCRRSVLISARRGARRTGKQKGRCCRCVLWTSRRVDRNTTISPSTHQPRHSVPFRVSCFPFPISLSARNSAPFDALCLCQTTRRSTEINHLFGQTEAPDKRMPIAQFFAFHRRWFFRSPDPSEMVDMIFTWKFTWMETEFGKRQRDRNQRNVASLKKERSCNFNHFSDITSRYFLSLCNLYQ